MNSNQQQGGILGMRFGNPKDDNRKNPQSSTISQNTDPLVSRHHRGPSVSKDKIEMLQGGLANNTMPLNPNAGIHDQSGQKLKLTLNGSGTKQMGSRPRRLIQHNSLENNSQPQTPICTNMNNQKNALEAQKRSKSPLCNVFGRESMNNLDNIAQPLNLNAGNFRSVQNNGTSIREQKLRQNAQYTHEAPAQNNFKLELENENAKLKASLRATQNALLISQEKLAEYDQVKEKMRLLNEEVIIYKQRLGNSRGSEPIVQAHYQPANNIPNSRVIDKTEELKNINSSLEAELRRYKNEIEHLRTLSNSESSKLSSQNKELLLQLSELKAASNSHASTLEEISRLKEDNQALSSRLANFVKSQKIIVSEKEEITQKYERVQKRERELVLTMEKSENDLLQRLEETNYQIRKLADDKKTLLQQQEELQQLLEVARGDLQETQMLLDQRDSALEDLTEENEKQLEDLSSLREERDNLTTEGFELREANANLEQQLKTISEAKTSQENQILLLDEERKELTSTVEKLREKVEELEEIEQQYIIAKEDILTFNEDIACLTDENEQLQIALNQTEGKLDNFLMTYDELKEENDNLRALTQNHQSQMASKIIEINTLQIRLTCCMVEIERLNLS